MRSLFLSPHNDDETLFGAFTILRYQPTVVICLAPTIQEARGHAGAARSIRRAETQAAMRILGADAVEQWDDTDDAAPDWGRVEQRLRLGRYAGYEQVFAPVPEEGGHVQHNMLGWVAAAVFGPAVIHYTTYTTAGKSEGRPWSGRKDFDLAWIALKLRALAEYTSQLSIKPLGCWPHFLRDLEEHWR